jgi:hypothetical protein
VLGCVVPFELRWSHLSGQVGGLIKLIRSSFHAASFTFSCS